MKANKKVIVQVICETMLILKAFKFELMPNGEQIRKMKQFCGCSRFVFNRALAYQNKQYEADKSFKFSYAKIANLLPEWKQELDWLKDCHSQVLQQSLKDLERGFKNFFAKRADFPQFKKKGAKDSFRFPQGCKLDSKITAFGCRKSVGYAIATAAMFQAA
ncbi:RNA-guided endonuclease InsQ/TnpB family protein [Neisseria sp. CCUG17229]|uniref:RNA-guided endonuclease InsQ/TnpB family protein n=1 Tax=Neisseria sp. CCUG17229 TaxID=3392036 RepID=UPI003A0FC79B